MRLCWLPLPAHLRGVSGLSGPLALGQMSAALSLVELTTDRILYWVWLKIKELGLRSAGFSCFFIYQGDILVHVFEPQPYPRGSMQFTPGCARDARQDPHSRLHSWFTESLLSAADPCVQGLFPPRAFSWSPAMFGEVVGSKSVFELTNLPSTSRLTERERERER